MEYYRVVLGNNKLQLWLAICIQFVVTICRASFVFTPFLMLMPNIYVLIEIYTACRDAPIVSVVSAIFSDQPFSGYRYRHLEIFTNIR